MSAPVQAVKDWFQTGIAGWNRFWFTPCDAAPLALLRICGGAMIFYTHLVWSLRLEAFFGQQGWITPEAAGLLPRREGSWSYFYWIDSPSLLWIVHITALVVFLMYTLGLFTRVTSILTAIAVVSYANRVPGATFGLDDTNVMLALYLAVGGGGQCFSLDAWLARKRGTPLSPLSARANIGLRLVQINLCIEYLFSGIGKLLGVEWWDGTAFWGAAANKEYQSLDITWLGQYPALMDVLTHLTIFWEMFYCALVWPRWTRPIALGMALLVHGGIALALGMKTFGTAMIIANMAFLPAGFVRGLLRQPLAPSEK